MTTVFTDMTMPVSSVSGLNSDAALPQTFTLNTPIPVSMESNLLISATIAQIKQLSTIFGGRVAGAAEFAAVKSQGFLATPAAYVIPLGSEATGNQSQSDLKQVMSSRIGIVCMFDNVPAVLAGCRSASDPSGGCGASPRRTGGC